MRIGVILISWTTDTVSLLWSGSQDAEMMYETQNHSSIGSVWTISRYILRADLIQGSRVGREVAEKRRIAYMGNASSYR
jgi:hypothetical protein